MLSRILKSTVLSLAVFLTLGLLAGMLIKGLALGAIGGLICRFIIIAITERYGSG